MYITKYFVQKQNFIYIRSYPKSLECILQWYIFTIPTMFPPSLSLSLFFLSLYLPLSNFIVFNTDNNLPNWKRLFEYYMYEFIIKNNVIRVLYNNKWVVPLFSHPFIISNRLYIHLFINKNWITNVLHYELNIVIMLRCGSCVIHEFVHTHAHTLGIRMEIIHRQKRTTIYFSINFNLEQ